MCPGKIFIKDAEDIKVFQKILDKNRFKNSLASDYLYKGCYLGDSSYGIPKEIQSIVKNALDDETSPRSVRDAFLSIWPSTFKNRSDKEVKDKIVNQFKEIRKIIKELPLPFKNDILIDRTKDIPNIDSGFGHVSSFISNTKRWRKEKNEYWEAKKEWKEKHQEYLFRKPTFEKLEKLTNQRINDIKQFDNPKIIEAASNAKIDIDELKAFVKDNKEYHNDYEFFDRKPRYSNVCGLPHIRKEKYNIKIIGTNIHKTKKENKNRSLKFSIDFKIDAELKNKSLYGCCRYFDIQKWSIAGVRIKEVKENYIVVDFRIEKERTPSIGTTPSGVSDKKFNVAYLDFGWDRTSVIYFKGNIHYLQLVKESEKQKRISEIYDNKRRAKESIPEQLKEKVVNIKDDIAKKAINELVKFCVKYGINRLILENPSRRRKLAGKRSNYMASSIRLCTFINKLEMKLKEYNIRLKKFYATAQKDPKTKKAIKSYYVSRTCDKCGKMGLRYNIFDGKIKEHRYGKMFVCLCGRTTDSDVLAVKNMRKADMNNLTSFDSYSNLNDMDKEQILSMLNQNAQLSGTAVTEQTVDLFNLSSRQNGSLTDSKKHLSSHLEKVPQYHPLDVNKCCI